MSKIYVMGIIGHAAVTAALSGMKANGIDSEALDCRELEAAIVEHMPTSFPIFIPREPYYGPTSMKSRYNRRAKRAARNNW